MRLFIAVNFDAETRRNILAVQERLQAIGRGNFSLPENLHLTLAFLGEVAPERTAAVRLAMERTVVPPAKLIFDRTGFFRREGGDLWWIGCAENPVLAGLHAHLCTQLSDQGFALEHRRFSPHITLARAVRTRQRPDGEALLGTPFSTGIRTVSLMLSERVGGTLTYTEQFSVAAEEATC